MKKEYDFSGAKRGPVIRSESGKTRITIRIDNDVVSWFKRSVEESGGGSYQSLINGALRQYIEQENGVLEDTLRRVIREELASAPVSTR